MEKWALKNRPIMSKIHPVLESSLSDTHKNRAEVDRRHKQLKPPYQVYNSLLPPHKTPGLPCLHMCGLGSDLVCLCLPFNVTSPHLPHSRKACSQGNVYLLKTCKCFCESFSINLILGTKYTKQQHHLLFNKSTGQPFPLSW